MDVTGKPPSCPEEKLVNPHDYWLVFSANTHVNGYVGLADTNLQKQVFKIHNLPIVSHPRLFWIFAFARLPMKRTVFLRIGMR